MKKTMYLWDIVFMNITAIIGLRWLPIAAGYGASAIILWILAALLFFIPLGLVSAELATTWPDQGGLYVWVKKAYGDKTAFLTSWFYWINSFFYWPSLFTFIAVTIAFIFDPALAKNKYFICGVVLVGLWAITLLNFISMKVVKFFSKLGGTFGVLLPGVIIIVMGFITFFIWKKPSPTDYSFANLLPNLGSGANLAMLSTLMFSMAGIEITPILAGETHNPQKTFPRSTLISALFIVGIYIIGTMAMTVMIAPEKIGAASGVMDALRLISTEFNLAFIVPIVAIMIIIGSAGGACIWLVAPIKMFFESCKEGILPKYFTKLNKNNMPRNAMLTQAIIVSIVVICTSFLPSVNIFYETLVLMATITYFIPYITMFCAFIKLRKSRADKKRPYRIPGGKPIAWIITSIGMASVLLAIILPFVMPPADITGSLHIMLYRIELMTGPVLFGLIGYFIYTAYERRKKLQEQEVEM